MKHSLNYILLLTLHISWTFARENNNNKIVDFAPELDKASAKTQLTVQDVPNPPQLLGIECTPKHATINWEHLGDNGSPILNYIIQYNTSFIPEEWNDFGQAPPFDTTYTVSLEPWANYTFRVIAVNKIGQSKPSLLSFVCSTRAEVPRKNPENVRGEGNQPDNLVITWTPMPQIEHGAPGFHYRVGWKRAIAGAELEFVDIHNYKQDKFVVPNQPSYQKYSIVVSAVNDLGYANVTPQVITGYSGENEPVLAPTNFTLLVISGPTAAVLRWEPVPIESIRGYFKGYKIKTWSEALPIAKEVQVQPGITTALVSNFHPYTTNYAQVYVFNGKYKGPPSSTISFLSPEGIPEEMTYLKAYPLGSSGFLLKWDKPDKPNGNLTGYNIYWSKVHFLKVDGLTSKNPQIKDPYMKSAKIGSLKANSNYRICIAATTKVGESKRYCIERTTRQQGSYKPSKPSFEWGIIKSLPHTSVRIRWLPTVDGNGGNHFFVKFRKRGELNWEQSRHEKNEDWIIISGLEDSTTYEFTVTAVDGSSSQFYTESDIQEIRTYNFEEPIIMVKEPVGGVTGMNFDNKSHDRANVSTEHKQGPESDYEDGDIEAVSLGVTKRKKQLVKPTNESFGGIETEETRKLTTSQLQRLVLLEQLQVLRMKKEKLLRDQDKQ